MCVICLKIGIELKIKKIIKSFFEVLELASCVSSLFHQGGLAQMVERSLSM